MLPTRRAVPKPNPHTIAPSVIYGLKIVYDVILLERDWLAVRSFRVFIG